jgi:hypothetical protein
MTNIAKLTAAFNAGYEAGLSGEDVTGRLKIAVGKQRDFWEAGQSKGTKEYKVKMDAYYASPEYAELCHRRNMDMAIITRLLRGWTNEIAARG